MNNIGTAPLCGTDWLRKHRNDYTQAEIERLSITVSVNGKSRLSLNGRHEKGTVKEFVKAQKEGE